MRSKDYLSKVGSNILKMVGGANIITILLMLIAGYSDRFSPKDFSLISQMGLVFPVFLVINLAFLALWLIVRRSWCIIPLTGMLLCCIPIRVYCPINLPATPPDNAVKILSYNVMAWGKNNDGLKRLLKYIIKQDADLVFLQETYAEQKNRARIQKLIKKHYPYSVTLIHPIGGNTLMVWSKHKLLNLKHIPYYSINNLSITVDAIIGKDTVLLINNHFESTGLSPQDRQNFKEMVKGKAKADSVSSESKSIIKQMIASSRIRTAQVDSVAKIIDYYLSYKPNGKIILAGDFNDTPISYTHHTLASRLTDCYVTTGNGLGVSYNRNAFYVRIDNVMCSSNIKPYGFHIDKSIKISDHYPIIGYLQVNKK